MARLSKFASMNLNDSYGKSQQDRHAGGSTPAANPLRHRSFPTQGGMLVLSWPCRQESAGVKPGKTGVSSSSPKLATDPVLEHPVSDPVHSPAVSPLLPGWLRNSQQQKAMDPPTLFAGSRSIHEMLSSTGSGGSSVALDAGSRRNSSVDSVADFGRPSVYVPPNLRTPHVNEVTGPTQPPSSRPEKAVIVREEFPTLQASIIRPPTPPQRQREVPKKQREEMTERQVKLQQMSPQPHAEKQNDGGEGLKLQPAQPLRLQHKGTALISERIVIPTGGRQGQPKDVNTVSSMSVPLVSLDHVNNWIDDERRTKGDAIYHEVNHSILEDMPLMFDSPCNKLTDAKKGSDLAMARESINAKQAKDVYVPPFAREGKFSKDHGLSREGLLSKEESIASDGRDRGYERSHCVRRDLPFGKEMIGRETYNRLENCSDNSSGRQNGDDLHYKQGLRGGSDSDTTISSKVSSHGKYIPPELCFGCKHSCYPQADEHYGGRSEVHLEYGQRASHTTYMEPSNPSHETVNLGTRRMAAANRNVPERAALEAEKLAEEEKMKKDENNHRNIRTTKDEVYYPKAGLVKTSRFLDEGRHIRWDNKESETRHTQENSRHYGHSTVEESSYLHGLGPKGFLARTERDAPMNWMTEKEKEEMREYVTYKFNEQEEYSSEWVVEDQICGEKSDLRRKNEFLPLDASMLQQWEEKVGSFSTEPEWDNFVPSVSRPGQGGNENSLRRPSSAGSSSTSAQWSHVTADEFSNHLNTKGARTSASINFLESKARGEPRSMGYRTVAWRKDMNAYSNAADSKPFSAPYNESMTVYRSTDSGSFKV